MIGDRRYPDNNKKLCCSKQTVSFHYLDFNMIKFINNLMDMIRSKKFRENEIVDEIINILPSSGVGGYEQKLKKEEVILFLKMMQQLI